MDPKLSSKVNTQVYEEACEWFVEFRAGDVDNAGRRAFVTWLRMSPQHVAAYLELAAIWNEGPRLDAKRQWDVDTLIAQAGVDTDNVVSLPRVSPGTPLIQRPGRHGEAEKRNRRTAFGWAASIAAICLAAGAWGWIEFIHAPTYATALGNQQSVTLEDGSIAKLNSRSRIKVRYSANERLVELLEGQALFSVHKDRARPFVVSSDTTRVRAVGTQFDVYRKLGGTVVTVVEGRVAVLGTRLPATSSHTGYRSGQAAEAPTSGIDRSSRESNSDRGRTVFLAAGEQVTVSPRTIENIVHPNIEVATAWTRRQLIFESASLSDVAEEFNRYNERPLIIQNPDLYNFHISGVFSSTDPTSLIRFLRQRPGVQVTETPTEIRVTKII